MPRVPGREQLVQDAALPGVRIQAPPSGPSPAEQIGGTLQKFGADMYAREIHYQDQAAILDAETKAGSAHLDILQRMKDFRGKDAAQAEDFAVGEFQKSTQKIRGGLSSDRQRLAYDKLMQPKQESLRRAALSHFNTENEKFLEDTFAANMQQSVDYARANADFPVQVAFEKDVQEMKIKARAERLGHDPDMVATQVTAAHSATNTAVVQALLTQGQDLRAKAYYDQITKAEKGADTEAGQGRLQFTAKDREHVERALGEGSTRGEAHRQFRNIMATVDTSTAEGRRVATNTANAMEDDKVGGLLLQKLDHAFGQDDKRKHEEHQAIFTNATKLIDEQWKQSPTKTAREMIPADQWANLSIQDRHTLDTYLEHFRDPGKKVTDLDTWVKLNAMKDEDLAKVSKSQMLAYVNKLDSGDGDKLLTRWNGVLNAKNPEGKQKDVKYEEFLTNKQLLDNAMELTGYFDLTKPRTQWSVEHQQLENRVQKMVDQALSQIPKDAPREKKEKAIQDIVDAQVKAKVKVDKGFFSFEKERAVGEFEDFKGAASIRVPLKDIPAGDQDLVKGLLREANKKLDNSKIERIYALKQLRKAGKLDRQALIDQTRKIIEE